MSPLGATSTSDGALNASGPSPGTPGLPEGSNFWIGATVEPAHVLPPQRSNTHTLLPSRSMSTPMAMPQGRPSGSFAQPSSTLYGLGAAFGSAPVCAIDIGEDTASVANAAAARAPFIRNCHIA